MRYDEHRLDTWAALSRPLDDRLAEWSLLTGIKVEVWALPTEQPPAHLAQTVHAVIEEVLREVQRQAQARTLSLALTVSPSGLRLTISDDGGGMPDEALDAFVVRLRARWAETAGPVGALAVNSVPGEGTTVSAAVPRQAFTGPRRPR
jgi:signal transduction histidine kinase